MLAFSDYSLSFFVNRLDKQIKTSSFTMAEAEATAADRNVEIWKIKKLIKSLEAARG